MKAARTDCSESQKNIKVDAMISATRCAVLSFEILVVDNVCTPCLLIIVLPVSSLQFTYTTIQVWNHHFKSRNENSTAPIKLIRFIVLQYECGVALPPPMWAVDSLRARSYQ